MVKTYDVKNNEEFKSCEPSYFQYLDLFSIMFDPDNSPITKNFSLKNIFPLNTIINISKAGVFLFTFFGMIYFNNYSKAAWCYLALHGSYGVIWIAKDLIFGDKGFKIKVNIIVAITLIVVLLLYYTMSFMIVTKRCDQNPSDERIFICFFLYILGVVLMIATDVQKYVVLEYKKGLIDNYLLKNNRNTNFFGEMMLYSSFAILTTSYIPFAILISIWSTVFVSRIWTKERSLMKKEGYIKYKKNSYILLFKIFSKDIYNVLFYSFIVFVSYLCYNNGGIEKSIKLLIN